MKGTERLAALLEAFLFVKGDPVSMKEMTETLDESSVEIEKALTLLEKKYEKNTGDTGRV